MSDRRTVKAAADAAEDAVADLGHQLTALRELDLAVKALAALLAVHRIATAIKDKENQ